MFSKSRRPVPSSAALRILYQLAYISSGTAVGVAALCAEERRRRTHYVQKIADNAKRLRQSPRHVHNVAAAKKAEHAEEEHSLTERGGDFWEEQSRQDCQERKNDRIRAHEPGERLVRAPELPSTVERGYAQVTRNHKRVRRRGPGEDIENQLGARGSMSDTQASKTATDHEPIHRPTFVERGRRGVGPLAKPYGASQPIDRFQVRPTGMPSVVQPSPRFWSKAAADLTQQTHRDSIRGTEIDPLGKVVHDVGVFFHNVPWTSDKLRTEASVASCLLGETLQHGCLKQVRQLVSWKLANDKLDEQDVALLHEAYSTENFEDDDALDVFELFAELFESKAFGKLSEELRLTTAISVAADSLSWNMDIPEESRAYRLLKCPLILSQNDRIDITVSQVCRERLATYHQVRRAYNVVTAVKAAQSGAPNATASAYNNRWKDVYEVILQHAKERGQLWIWSHHFVRSNRDRNNLDWVSKLEWLLQECRRLKSYKHLGKLSTLVCQTGIWRVLNDQAKVDFAMALASRHKRKGILKEVFLAIPEALRGPVIEELCAGRLQMIWKTQQNLVEVWNEYDNVKWYQTGRFGPAELTLIEICNKANQPDQALKLLSSSFRPESHSNLSLCIAAVSLARKSAWKQLNGLLGIIASSGNFTNDASTGRNLNSVIDIFSRHHSASETWRFVTDMIGAIGFAPNQITTDIMLQCFVSKQTLNLIPQWIRYLRTIGNDFQLSSRSATKLISCFYYERRPPHVLLMWFSRNLTNKWPSFNDSVELKDLIKASIGFDLRKANVQDKGLLRERAEHNLERLEAAKTGIPAPHRPTDIGTDMEPRVSVEEASVRPDEVVGDQISYQPFEGQDSQKVEPHHSTKQSELSGDFEGHSLEEDFVPDRQTQPSTDLANNGDFGNTIPDSEEFANLRPECLATDHASGEDQDDLELWNETTEVPEYILHAKRQRGVVREMILALSLRQYPKVLDLYHASLTDTGLPISPLALEVAADASVRLHKGDITDATIMFHRAESAGLDVRRAMGPLIIHQIHGLTGADKKDANKLRTMVIDYYRTNEENGFPVRHHVGITAANTLINNHRPEYGINMLNAIYYSEWVLERPLDIVAMTVYLKGFASLRSEGGILWVLRKVLKGNMTIDRPFISALKDVCRSFGVAGLVRRTRRMRFDQTGFISRLRVGRQECIARRAHQRFKTKQFGNLLVKKILEAAQVRERPTVDLERRREIEESFFGQAEEGLPMDGEPHLTDGTATQESQPADALSAYVEAQEKKSEIERPPRSRLEVRRAKARIASAIRFQGEDRSSMRRTRHQTLDPEWLKQYRAFVKKDLITADGKLASFRRYVY